MNFVNDVGEAATRSAYPDATWDRLAAIKERYDPTNLFRRNHNVPPAGATARDGTATDEAAGRIHVHKV